MKKKFAITTLSIITAVSLTTISFSQSVEAQGLIPEWIKNNAGWWANDEIDDQTFLNGIEYLVENKV